MDILIPFTKVWKFKDDKYGEAPHLFNPNSQSIEGIEECRIHDNNGNPLRCTKIFFPGRIMILLGSPEEFIQKCREANVGYGLLLDLQKEGMTIKEFIQQNERLNGVELS